MKVCQATANNCNHRKPRDTNANFLHPKGHMSDFATRPVWMAYIILYVSSINSCSSIVCRETEREREIRSASTQSVASTMPLRLCQCSGLQPAKPLAEHQSSEMARSFPVGQHGTAFQCDPMAQSLCRSLCQGPKLNIRC